MRRIRFTLLVGLLLSSFACAQVPRESVELSVTVGRDLAEVHRAHRELAVRYFDQIKGDIDAFVDEVYRPYTIENSMRQFGLIDRVVAAQAPGAKVDALSVMALYVAMVSEEIEAYRQELLDPIEAYEREVLTGIDDAYQKLQNANAIVTGHLASIRKVHDAQEELLEKAGMENLRGRFVEETVYLSERVADLVEKGRKADEKAGELEETIRRLKELVKTIQP
jgi:hypothetical protein